MAAAVLTGSLILSACDGTTTPRPDGYMTLTPGANDLVLSPSGSTTVKVPQGTYSFQGLPTWLKVASRDANGWTYLTFTGDALEAVPVTASRSSVTGTVTVSGGYTVNLVLRLGKVSGVLRADGSTTVVAGAGAASLNTPEAALRFGTLRVGTPGRTSRLLVQFRAGALTAQTLKALGVTPVGSMQAGGQQTQIVEAADPEAALRRLRQNPAVARVIRDVKLSAQGAAFTPSDPLAPVQWQMPLLGYGDVLADQTAHYPNAVTVAVVDSGIKAQHADLQGRLYGSADGAADFVSDPANGDGDGVDTNPDDPTSADGASHGTAVTGLIAAGNNSVGIAGGTLSAPVKVLPVRVLGADMQGTLSEVMLGVRYAAGEDVTYQGITFKNPHPAQVINVSIGESGSNLSADEKAFICEAIAAATGRGALVVAASGNTGLPDVMYPAACAGTLAVASVTLKPDKTWTHASYSAYGSSVALSAPGGWLATSYNGGTYNNRPLPDGILSTEWQANSRVGVYGFEQGTSFAAPQVSAAAALLLSKGVTRTAQATRERLISTATDVDATGRDNGTGAGLLNVSAALGLSAPVTTPPDPVTPTPGDTKGALVTVTAKTGKVFRPAPGEGGAWTAHLPDGTYTVRSGIDANSNSTLESGETVTTKDVTLGTGGVTLP